MTLRTGNRSADAGDGGGFTLIELMLVMAMLLIVVGAALPSLKHFFRGRNLDSEARRFISLTHYGQSRAVSDGVPMVLWIDAPERTYGLQAAAGYLQEDSKAVEFELDKDMEIKVTMPLAAGTTANRGAIAPGAASTLPMIRFSPDGFISDPSPDSIQLRQGEEDSVWIGQSANRQNYEIQANHLSNARR
ncbi:MAG TPA: GspH/FimT family pseudopilin [Verrucomicrobiae bacterium]|jgi:type II secretion system protein H